VNFNVLCDSCSESHFRGPVKRDEMGVGTGIEVDDKLDELTKIRKASRSTLYSLPVLIILLSENSFFAIYMHMYIEKINYPIRQ